MQCDMCGKDQERLQRAKVEGVEMKLCSGCSRFGKVMSAPLGSRDSKKKFSVKKKRQDPIDNRRVISSFASLIKNGREKSGMKQEDLAKKINEKASLLHNVESGHKKPSIRLAQKLERALKIKLIDDMKDSDSETKEDIPSSPKKQGPLTIGDLINFKK